MSSDAPEDGYSVGYKRPPLHSRFRKGASGNRAGRPQGSRNLKTDFLEEMNQTIPVTEGGKQRTLSKQQITIKALITQAMKGDIRAAAKVIDLSLRLCPQDQPDDAERDLSLADQEILAAFLKRHAGEQ
jgi:hypothetical protein